MREQSDVKIMTAIKFLKKVSKINYARDRGIELKELSWDIHHFSNNFPHFTCVLKGGYFLSDNEPIMVNSDVFSTISRSNCT